MAAKWENTLTIIGKGYYRTYTYGQETSDKIKAGVRIIWHKQKEKEGEGIQKDQGR